MNIVQAIDKTIKPCIQRSPKITIITYLTHHLFLFHTVFSLKMSNNRTWFDCFIDCLNNIHESFPLHNITLR